MNLRTVQKVLSGSLVFLFVHFVADHVTAGSSERATDHCPFRATAALVPDYTADNGTAGTANDSPLRRVAGVRASRGK